ncbi:MAG: TrkH family potassium uptake protein [Acidimicrobiaceae bacterium]|nr:TrkH family potassium uptake protein [Acidimicrobiaceae bacterium]MYL02852.1 TrkH family potassium uptake protein [Acidimicrobiaceae bacterium]
MRRVAGAGGRLAAGRLRLGRFSRARPLLAGRTEKAPARVVSWALASVVDAGLVVGVGTMLCGLAGIGDDNADAVAFACVGAACAIVAAVARRRVAAPARASAGRVFAGIGLLWTLLVLFGAALYAGTGSLRSFDDALVESAAGFTTTAVTLLDADEASRTVLLFRGVTSWVGGLIAILIAVVTLPVVLRSTALIGYTTGRRGLDLVPNASVGTRRVLVLYGGFTAACVVAYLLTGLPLTEALVLGLGTASTGGFTGQADSLAGYGAATQAVAAAGMLVAGAGIFVIWWIARGRLRPLWRSQELRTFVLLLAVAIAAMAVHRGIGWGEAGFMAVSMMSTTGFAIADWTGWGTSATVIMLVAAGIGTMMGSPGGGMKVMRARLLMGSAGGELRRQLDPYALILVRRDGETLSRRTLDRLGGHQIAWVVLVGIGVLLLGVSGVSLLGSVWGSVSAVSTVGPGMGEIGAFGRLEGLGRPGRLALVPLMMGGRMSIPPLMAGVGLVLHWYRAAVRRSRFLVVRAEQRRHPRPEPTNGDG